MPRHPRQTNKPAPAHTSPLSGMDTMDASAIATSILGLPSSLPKLCGDTLALQHKILVERGENYGDFGDNARVWVELLNALGFYFPPSWSFVQVAAALQITSKLSRITVSPGHQDSWLDIANYAALTHSDNMR